MVYGLPFSFRFNSSFLSRRGSLLLFLFLTMIMLNASPVAYTRSAQVQQIRVFLADFEDAPHPSSYKRDYFRQLFFGLGSPRATPEGDPLGGSVREFFLNVSGGRLDVHGEVADWVRLPGKITKVPHWKGGMEPFGESWPIVIAETLRANGIVGKDAKKRLQMADGSMPDGLVFLNTDFGMGGVRREWDDLKAVLAKMGRSELWDPAWEELGMPLGSFSVTHWPDAPGTEKDGTLKVEIPQNGQRFFPLSVMMHEMGHLLADLPDLYGPAFEPWGVFDLMGGPAAWTHFPMTFNSYLRESKGWMTYRDLSLTNHPGLDLYPLETHVEALRLRMGPDADSEALILENRWRLEYPPRMAGPPLNRGPRLLAYRVDPGGRYRQPYGESAIPKITSVIRRPERYGEVWGEPGFMEITRATSPSSRNALGELWWELKAISPDQKGAIRLNAELRAVDLIRSYTEAHWEREDNTGFSPGHSYEEKGGVSSGSAGPAEGGGKFLRIGFSSSEKRQVMGTWRLEGENPWRLYLTAHRADPGQGDARITIRSGKETLLRQTLPKDASPIQIALDSTNSAADLSVAVEGQGPLEVRISDAWLVELPTIHKDLLKDNSLHKGLISSALFTDDRLYGPHILTGTVGGNTREWKAEWRVQVPSEGTTLRAQIGLLHDSGEGEAAVGVQAVVEGKTIPLIQNITLAARKSSGVGSRGRGEPPAILAIPLPPETKGREAILEIRARSTSNQQVRMGIPTLILCDS